MDTITVVFYAFLPCLVILIVGLLAYLAMKFLPKSVQKILNFNFTNPSANRARSSSKHRKK